MNNEYENLIKLLKMFKNRPYHLAKYLLNNSALDKNFLSKLNISDINDFNELNFTSIDEMENFYLSLIDVKNLEKKSKEELKIELNEKLDEAIKNENYEEAARLRDYMQIKSIKRKK
jgi:excinuclease UvrABC helicase subunit UvrB